MIRKKKVKRLEKKINCKKQLSIRKDSWLKVVKVPVCNILQAIYYWTRGFKLAYISEFSEISDKIMEKITKYLCLTAAQFKIQHPEIGRIGSLNRDGESIYVLIDETVCGRRKFNRGNWMAK